MKNEGIIARAFALFVGAGLTVILPLVLTPFLLDPLLLIVAFVTAYGITGVPLGFLWPSVGWRLGLWLFAPWFLMLLFGAFIGGDISWHFWSVFKSLGGYLMIGVAACVGAQVGAFIKRRQEPNYHKA